MLYAIYMMHMLHLLFVIYVVFAIYVVSLLFYCPVASASRAARPFTWRERRLIGIAAVLVLLLALSDALLVYLGTRDQEPPVAKIPEKPALNQPIQGKYNLNDKSR